MAIFLRLRNKIIHWWNATLLGSTFASFRGSKARARVRFVVATRLSEKEFWRKSLTGKRLSLLKGNVSVDVRVFASNKAVLASVYNTAIDESAPEDILVFVHDDVWFNDSNVLEKIRLAVFKFDVIGIAGNTRRSPDQPAWLFKSMNDEGFIWDHGFLSGAVQCGDVNRSAAMVYGPCPASCELLDGVFLAARRKVLIRSNVRFDERFGFDFYDMDFCRTARWSGLALGTWPLDLFHASGGAFGSESWHKNYRIYLDKWKK